MPDYVGRKMNITRAQKLDLSRKLLLGAAGFASLAVAFGVIHAAQIQTEEAAGFKHLKFGVVSIRQNKAGGPQQFGTATPDGYRMQNMFLAAPILAAYVPQTGGAMVYTEEQIVGLPAWLTSDEDRYDINAKVDEAGLTDWQNPAKQPAMLRAMLRTMLADRLKLVAHRTMKEAPVYLLIRGKNGPKLEETNPGAPHSGSYPIPGGGLISMELKDGQQTLHYFGISMGQVATLVLNGAVDGRSIQDRTGLTGKYDITIWKPTAPPEPQAPFHAPDPGPSAFSLAEQLGLKLEPGKGQVETLVIDHVERPSNN
jgi:bla regulator protein BlaR1